MKKKNKKYCENRECEHNVLFSCDLSSNDSDVPEYYQSSGETGQTQYGTGAQNNFLHNAVQAEDVIPVKPYIKQNESKKNLHKN